MKKQDLIDTLQRAGLKAPENVNIDKLYGELFPCVDNLGKPHDFKKGEKVKVTGSLYSDGTYTISINEGDFKNANN